MTKNLEGRLKEFKDELDNFNDYFLDYKQIQLSVIRYIKTHLSSYSIQKVLDYPGERDTSTCTEYYDLVERVFRQIEPDWDCGCSQGHHGMIGFVSDAILYLLDRNKAVQLRIKKDKILQLKREQAILEEEIRDAAKAKKKD